MSVITDPSKVLAEITAIENVRGDGLSNTVNNQPVTVKILAIHVGGFLPNLKDWVSNPKIR